MVQSPARRDSNISGTPSIQVIHDRGRSLSVPLVGVALTCGYAGNDVVGGEVFQGAQDGPLGVCQRDADGGRVGWLVRGRRGSG